jgi:hypothetical protein
MSVRETLLLAYSPFFPIITIITLILLLYVHQPICLSLKEAPGPLNTEAGPKLQKTTSNAPLKAATTGYLHALKEINVCNP